MQTVPQLAASRAPCLTLTQRGPLSSFVSSLHIPSHAAADNELKIVLCEGIIGCTKRGGLAWPWLAGLYFPHMSHMSLRGRSVGIIPFMRPHCHVNHGRVCSACKPFKSTRCERCCLREWAAFIPSRCPGNVRRWGFDY